jgi:hypothetical protein
MNKNRTWKTRDARRVFHKNASPIVMRKALEFAGGIRLDHKEFNDGWNDTLIFPNQFAEKMYRAHFLDETDIKTLPPLQRHLAFYAVYEDENCTVDRCGAKAETLKHKDTVRSMMHHSGNVIAINMDDYEEKKKKGYYKPEAYSAIFFHTPNTTQLSWGSMSWDYIWSCCKRIPFKLALEIHPALFAGEYLNAYETEQEVVEETK